LGSKLERLIDQGVGTHGMPFERPGQRIIPGLTGGRAPHKYPQGNEVSAGQNHMDLDQRGETSRAHDPDGGIRGATVHPRVGEPCRLRRFALREGPSNLDVSRRWFVAPEHESKQGPDRIEVTTGSVDVCLRDPRQSSSQHPDLSIGSVIRSVVVARGRPILWLGAVEGRREGGRCLVRNWEVLQPDTRK
jgi:hypothetical protein